MTIDKAIELLKAFRIPLLTDSDHDNYKAILLGIQALLAIKAERTGHVIDYRHPLPGETV